MPRPKRIPDLGSRILGQLAAAPGGLSSPALQARLRPRPSQPTLSRALATLRAEGKVVATGAARAHRYHLVDGRLGMAELRSRLLHEAVARRLLTQPGLKEKARARLAVLATVNPAGRPYHERWNALLAGETASLLRAMTEDSEQAAALRRESPFTALLPKVARQQIFRQFRQ